MEELNLEKEDGEFDYEKINRLLKGDLTPEEVDYFASLPTETYPKPGCADIYGVSDHSSGILGIRTKQQKVEKNQKLRVKKMKLDLDKIYHKLHKTHNPEVCKYCKQMGGATVVSYEMPSENISPEKAKQMLKDGTAHGHPLTDKQKKMLGAAVGRGE
jgi:hypothetical protein